MYAAYYGHGHDRSISGAVGQSRAKQHRDILLQALMGTGEIEVRDIGVEYATELLLVQDKKMIETLPTHAP
jgi:hypothetical protein